MKHNPAPPDTTKKTSKVEKVKKPYRKPSFRHERVFETLALSCGKVSSTGPQCQFSRKTS